jgi:hypothetical protein
LFLSRLGDAIFLPDYRALKDRSEINKSRRGKSNWLISGEIPMIEVAFTDSECRLQAAQPSE